jgi:hypothetical protein
MKEPNPSSHKKRKEASIKCEVQHAESYNISSSGERLKTWKCGDKKQGRCKKCYRGPILVIFGHLDTEIPH